MRDIIIQLFLLIIGGIVFSLLFVVGVLYTLGKHIWKLDYSPTKHLIPIIRSLTLILDGLANAGAGELLNDTFKIKGEIRYGRWDKTISAITGLIFLYIKDTKLRRTLDRVLGKNHCVDAITKEDSFYYNNRSDTFV